MKKKRRVNLSDPDDPIAAEVEAYIRHWLREDPARIDRLEERVNRMYDSDEEELIFTVGALDRLFKLVEEDLRRGKRGRPDG